MILIPKNLALRDWTIALLKTSGKDDYLYAIDIDFTSLCRNNLPWLIKLKLKRLLKNPNKTLDQYLQLIQIATFFCLREEADAVTNKHLDIGDIIYDSTTDFFYTVEEWKQANPKKLHKMLDIT